MTRHSADCRACGETVSGDIYHQGFADMDALYCSSCPKVLLVQDRRALLGRFAISWPALEAHSPGFEIYCRHLMPAFERLEALFEPCTCGGHYRYMNPPRCPGCNGLLRGDLYEDKPISKINDLYVFATAGVVYDAEQLRPELR